MSLADRVARLEAKLGAEDERLVVIVHSFARVGAVGAPIQRLRYGLQVWERRDEEDEDALEKRARAEVAPDLGASVVVLLAD